MNRRRHVELISGLTAGLLGLTILILLVVGPAYRHQETGVQSNGTQWIAIGATSMVQLGLSPAAKVFLIAVGLSLLTVAIGTSLHSWRGLRIGQQVLWPCAAILLVLVCVSIFSIGLFLLPFALLTVVAAVASRRTHPDDGVRGIA